MIDIDEEWLESQGFDDMNKGVENVGTMYQRTFVIPKVDWNSGSEIEFLKVRIYACNTLTIYKCVKEYDANYEECEILKADVFYEDQLCTLVNITLDVEGIDLKLKPSETTD